MKNTVTKAVEQLQTDPQLKRFNLSITERSGEIVLQGQVPKYYFKQLAGEVVMRAIRNNKLTTSLRNHIHVSKGIGWDEEESE